MLYRKGLRRSPRGAAEFHRHYRIEYECVSKCLKRIFGVFDRISALISLDLAPLSLREIALKCSQIHSKLHLPAFRNTL